MRGTALPDSAVNRAQRLAATVHGDGDAHDVKNLLCGLNQHNLYALCVTLAAMVDVDKTPAELLEWNDGPPKPRGKDEARRLILAAADFYAVTLEELFGRSKTPSLVWARHVAMWLCVRDADLNLSEAGRMFDRDHSTVLHAVRRIDTLRANGTFRRPQLAAAS